MGNIKVYLSREGFGINITPRSTLPGGDHDEIHPELVSDLLFGAVDKLPSADQRRLFWLDRALGGDPSLNINIGFEIAGHLDLEALESACRRLVLLEPVLRQCFADAASGPVIRSIDAFPGRLFEYTDLSHVPPDQRQAAVLRHARQTAARAFDLTSGPLFRLDLLRIEQERHVLYITMHHAVSDLRSLFAVCTSLLRHHEDALAGRQLSLAASEPVAPPSVDDHATEQTRAYWLEMLRNVSTEPLFPDSGGNRHHRPAAVAKTLFPPELWSSVAGAAKRHGVAGMVLMMAAFRLWLAELSGRDRFTFTTPLQRDRTPGLKIGFTGAPMLLDGSIDKNWSIAELVADTRGKLKALSRHRDISFTELDGLSREAGLDTWPGASAMFSFSPFPFDPEGSGVVIERLWPMSRPVTDFDLAVWVGDWGRGAERVFILEYDRSRFDRFDAAALSDRYFALLAMVARDGDEQTQPVPALTQSALAATPLQLRILANFTAEPLREVLEFWAELLDVPLRIDFAGYNQILQELLDVDSKTRSNKQGVNVILLRPQDWIRERPDRTRLMGDHRALETVLSEAGDEYIAALVAAADSVPVMVSIVPADPGPAATPASIRVLQQVEDRLRHSLVAASSIQFLPWEQIASRFAVNDPLDRIADELGHVPLSHEGFAALGTAIMRLAHENWRRPFKVIVVDCDNTLWKGVVGEVGWQGILLEERHLRLQSALAAASRAGILICLCSKNQENDVLDVFKQRTDMVLRQDHLTAWRINWDLKSANIRDLADTLGLGLDSIVMLDDNPVEIAEIGSALPQVTAIRFPTEGAADFADHMWVLDHTRTTREDLERSGMYKREAERAKELRTSASYAQFLASLNLRVRIQPPAAEDLERIAQLTVRTNQFNINPAPASVGEVRDDCRNGARLWLAVHVEDRFGAYGLVGAIAAREAGTALVVDTFLMSCRVLGRGAEHRMLAAAGELAVARGLTQVIVPFRATQRNMPARRFFEQLGAQGLLQTESIEAGEGASPAKNRYTMKAEDAASIDFSAEQGQAALDAHRAESQDAQEKPAKMGRIAQVTGAVFETIATEYGCAGTIAKTVWQQPRAETPSGRRDKAEGRDAASSASIEELVRACLRDIAGLETFDESVALWQNGLSSLTLMRVVAELRRRAGISVAFSDIYESATFRELIARIAKQPDDSATPPRRHVAEDDLMLLRGVIPHHLKTIRDNGGAVFMTGGTGFLGAHLVAEMLARSERDIICLVRAESDSSARQRVLAALERSGHGEVARVAGRRLHAVAGDLDKTQMGLAPETYAALVERADLLLHNAAQVSFSAPYEALREANVLGTLEMVRLAIAASAPLHFVSTLSIFDAQSWLGHGFAGEQDLPENIADILHGYAQTKYVSERHLHAARARGLVCSIYRPGNIAGDSVSGVWVEGDAITRLLRACIDLGIVPDQPRTLDLTPVDYVAKSMAALVLQAPEANRNFHLVNPVRFSSDDIAGWCHSYGFPMEMATAGAWGQALEQLCENEPDHPAAPLLPLFHASGMGEKLTMFDLVDRRPVPDRSHAEAFLKPLGITCPGIDAAIFSRSLAVLIRNGYLRDISLQHRRVAV